MWVYLKKVENQDSLVYVSIPEKGGESIIIGKDGDVLYADSSVGYLHNRQAEKFKMVHWWIRACKVCRSQEKEELIKNLRLLYQAEIF